MIVRRGSIRRIRSTSMIDDSWICDRPDFIPDFAAIFSKKQEICEFWSSVRSGPFDIQSVNSLRFNLELSVKLIFALLISRSEYPDNDVQTKNFRRFIFVLR